MFSVDSGMSKSSVYFSSLLFICIFLVIHSYFSVHLSLPIEEQCCIYHWPFCSTLGLYLNTYRAQKSPTLQLWNSNVSNGCFNIFCSSGAQGEGKVIDCCSPQTARLKGKDTKMQFIMHVDISGHWNVLRMKNKHKSLNIKILGHSILLDRALQGKEQPCAQLLHS